VNASMFNRDTYATNNSNLSWLQYGFLVEGNINLFSNNIRCYLGNDSDIKIWKDIIQKDHSNIQKKTALPQPINGVL